MHRLSPGSWWGSSLTNYTRDQQFSTVADSSASATSPAAAHHLTMSLRQITRVLRAPAFARTYATAAPTPPTASSEPAPAPASPAPASRVRKISASSPSKTTGRTHARYQVRPPRYYRGPFHPIQPPKPSAPNSREFIPGPFGRERTPPPQPTLPRPAS